MEEPIKLRLKPCEVEAIQYKGDNVEKIMEWVRKLDPSATYGVDYVYPVNAFSDGATRVSVTEFVEICVFDVCVIRVYKDQWIFKNSKGLLSVHHPLEVEVKYERVK